LRSTQQRERRKRLKEGIEELEVQVGCSVSAVIAPPSIPPASLLHLSTSTRDQIRSVEGISIPSEKKMIQEKKKLSESHGTATASFSNGAYISDPLSFISTILPSSSFICVGGDAGGGQTKLGCTFF
jgi:hypothetical protein